MMNAASVAFPPGATDQLRSPQWCRQSPADRHDQRCRESRRHGFPAIDCRTPGLGNSFALVRRGTNQRPAQATGAPNEATRFGATTLVIPAF